MTTKKSAGKTPAKAAQPKAADAAKAEADPGLGLDDQAATPPAGDQTDADAGADAQAETTAETPAGEGDDTAAPPDAAADAQGAVTVASGVGRYRVVKTGAEIRLANARAAARVAAGELERV